MRQCSYCSQRCSNVETLTEVPLDCTQINAVDVTYNATNGISVNHEEICVDPGSKVVFTFEPVPPMSEARTKFKGIGNGLAR